MAVVVSRRTPTAYVIGWEAGVSNLASCLVVFFCRKPGLERWLPPREFVLGVDFSSLYLGPFLLYFLCSLILTFFVGGVRLSVFVLLSALC